MELGLALAVAGGWRRSRLLESSVRTLITADRLSRCALQHNPVCDWLGLAGWLVQMRSSSSTCRQEDGILLSNEKPAKRSEIQLVAED